MVIRVFCAAILGLGGLLCLPQAVFAHDAPVHEHMQILPLPAYSPPAESASGDAALEAMTELLASLDSAQQAELSHDLHAPDRLAWSNLPAGFSGRAGMPLSDMSDMQRGLVFKFLSASLSEDGYRRIADVMAAEGALSQNGRGGNRYLPENYYLSVYGEPADKGEWGWRFGGHHLGVNVSIEDGRVESLSPTHIGSEPVLFTLNGIEYSNMVDMHAAGLAVFNALSTEQKVKASELNMVREMLGGPGAEGYVPDTEGVSASTMTAEQKALLETLIKMWIGLQPEENADARMIEIMADIDSVTFGWAGSENPTDTGYFRVQGPSLIIEHVSFGSRRRVASDTDGHYHTMYRNPLNDYGRE